MLTTERLHRPARRSVVESGAAKPVSLHDLRFRVLLGEAGWNRLPAAVRDRFSKRLRPGMAVTYAGRITESRRNAAGHVLAQLCRLIGAPLPLNDDLGAAAVVTVTEDGAAEGQFWTRMYNRAHGFPQVIHSSKRFAGPTGLEEYLGGGFGIALAVSADETALHFHSRHYFLGLGPVRMRLPAWLEPGALTISHIDQGDGGFAFVLDLRHPLLGGMLRQVGLFRERPAPLPDDNEGYRP